MKIQKCRACNLRIKGRSDKKFCNDQCRTAFHNQQRRQTLQYTRTINAILRKNRSVLATLTSRQKVDNHVSKYQLERMGFNFTYHTHTYLSSTGKLYYFCYEHGYLPLENGYFALISKSSPDYGEVERSIG